MLYTNLKHIETIAGFHEAISASSLTVIVCGRMDEESIVVFRQAELLQKKYLDMLFFDLEFDNPASLIVCEQIDVINNTKIPFVAFFSKGEMLFGTNGNKLEEDLLRFRKMNFKTNYEII